MIQFQKGNLFDTEAEAVVNTVNCVGIMGRGLALKFKTTFPDNFRAYAEACRNHRVSPGRMFVFRTEQSHPRYVINFPTKRHWRNKSRLRDIETGLDDLRSVIQDRDIKSIAIPALGTHLGGLDWNEVRARIEDALHDLDGVQITVFRPGGSGTGPAPRPAPSLFASRPTGSDENPTSAPRRPHIVPRMTVTRGALLELIRRYLDGLLDPYLTLLEVHKLMYFLQSAGEPVGLKYVKGWYGPYADNLRHLLHSMERFFEFSAEEGDAPHRPLEPIPEAMERASTLLTAHPTTRARCERVRELIAGFEDPAGLELLSTVHWVLDREQVRDLNEIVAKIYAWHPRKRRFAPRQIGIAVDTLHRGGWIELGPEARTGPDPWEPEIDEDTNLDEEADPNR